MSKETKNPFNDWEGSLSDQFEQDIQLPSDDNWTAIEQELFPNKKRRFVTIWIALSTVFLTGMAIIFIQKTTEYDHKMVSKGQENRKLIEKIKSEKKSSKTYKQKTNLNFDFSKKVGQFKIKEPKSIRNKKTFESILSNFRQPKINKNQKTLSNQNNSQTNSTNKIPSISDIVDPKTSPTTSDNTKTSVDNWVIKNSNEISKNFDSIICLNLLPMPLLSITKLPSKPELIKKNKTEFKPYFSVQISPLIGKNIRIISGAFNNVNNYSNAIGDRRVSLPKYGFHLGFNYHIEKRLSVNTGFQLTGGEVQSRWFFKYLKVDPSTNDVRLKTSSGEASTTDPKLIQNITNWNSGIYKLRINHAYSLFSIPVGITYRYTVERFSPFFRTGLNMEFFGKRSLSLDVMENGLVRNIELNLNRPNNRLNLQAMVAIGIETSIKNNWSFFAEGGYYFPLNQFVNANGYSVRMAGSNILGGVRYDLK